MQQIDLSNNPPTVGDILNGFIEHPVETIFWRWNWKAALLSSCVRGSLFFAANLGSGLEAAVGAMLLESAFYITVAGFYGAIIGGFRRAQPVWTATLMVMLLMPAINHSLEFLLHFLGGTVEIAKGVAVSTAFSMFSATFNLFAMRRGVLLVGAGRQSMVADLRKMPRIIFDFVTVLPRLLWRILRQPQGIGGKSRLGSLIRRLPFSKVKRQ